MSLPVERRSAIIFNAEPIDAAVERFDRDFKEAREGAQSARMQHELTDEIDDGYISREELVWERGVLSRFARLERFRAKGQVPVRYEFRVFGRGGAIEVGRPRG